jgi:hypothetical protein
MGYYFVFLRIQQQIRTEVKQQIKGSLAVEDLHTITIPTRNKKLLKWEQEGCQFPELLRLLKLIEPIFIKANKTFSRVDETR